ncbi:MAG: FAD-dependent oxidoreductase [Candidatus Thorarchaeota archaeon]|nr:MAG: FAD-dependent oxidoreductase [Candidatus Thorarchaeota archaeon]
MSIVYDTIIIGGGPAGCSAALHLGYHKRKVLVLDRGTSPMHFHTNSIMNFSTGMAYTEGRTLIRQLSGAAKGAGAKFRPANVCEVSGAYPEFTVETEPSYRTKDRSLYKAKTIIFATGTARKHPIVDGHWRKWLPIANAGNGAFYCPDCEAPLTKGKRVLVVNVGTVGSALHIANSVARFTKKIRILMTEDAYVPFRDQDFSKLDESPFPWTSGKIKSVRFIMPGTSQTLVLESGERLSADVFFVAFVAKPRTEIAQALGIEVDDKGNIVTDKRGKTNVEGVWAAGDCRAITQQVAMAVGTGNYAALMVNQFLGNEAEKEAEFDHPEMRELPFL